jgi:hypothetical protein
VVAFARVTLANLAGGVLPQVTTTLEVSDDLLTWYEWPNLNPVGGLIQTANGAGFLHAGGAPANVLPNTGLAPRYIRAKSTGGGGTPPTAWNTKLELNITASV